MDIKRPNADSPDAGVVDDKMAEARERAERIQQENGDAGDQAKAKAKGNGDDDIEDAALSGRQGPKAV
jgi:hypothetical protein